MKCIYIGDVFYRESDSMMSCVYELSGTTYIRTDWGKIQIALAEKETVEIRPANEKEINKFNQDLINLLKEKSK